jgi:hypothetical protein
LDDRFAKHTQKKSLSVCLKIVEGLHQSTHFETNEEDFLSDVADGDGAFIGIVLLSPGEFSLIFRRRRRMVLAVLARWRMVLAMVTVVLLNAIRDCITDEMALGGFLVHSGFWSDRRGGSWICATCRTWVF